MTVAYFELLTLPDGPRYSNHLGKVSFRELARVVSSNWKGLQPEVKESYGKLAAFQRRQYELEIDKSPTKVWQNHQKVTPPITFANVEIPSLVENEDVEQVVDDVLAELEMDESTQTEKKDNPAPEFWPLLGPPTPIGDFVRNQCYPQFALTHTNTCLPCTMVLNQKPYIDILKKSLDEDCRDFFLNALKDDDDVADMSSFTSIDQPA